MSTKDASMSASTENVVKLSLTLIESEIVKLVLEFLESHGLHIAQIALERESGIINGNLSSDALFLRQLILDGSWDTALDFVEPLKGLPEFDHRRFKYLILKYKYFELLCIKNEPGCLNNNEFTVEELVECLQSLEPLCSTPDDYRSLCALLTLPKLGDHADFARWNPSSARIECFNQIFPIVRKFLGDFSASPSPTVAQIAASNERLVQLVVRGIMYENCMELCQSRAVRSKSFDPRTLHCALISDPQRSLDPKVDASLYSWLKCVPLETFSLPFSREFLDVRMEPLRRPQLEAQWTEQILATPIKPNMFPYNATPVTRLKSAEKMSLSMIPQYEAISNGYDARLGFRPESAVPRHLTALSGMNDVRPHLLSQSVAVGFQISGPRNLNFMQQSAIDVLLETSPDTRISSGVGATAYQIPPTDSRSVAVVAPSARQNASLDVEDDEFGTWTRRQSTVDHTEEQRDIARPLTARQQLDDMRLRAQSSTAPDRDFDQPIDDRQSFINTSESEIGAQPLVGKLFDEFSKNRNIRGASEPLPATSADNLAFQMMQLSFYSAGRNRSHLPNFSLPNPVNMNSSIYDHSPPQRIVKDTPVANLESKAQGQSSSGTTTSGNFASKHIKFIPVCRLEDQQAIRTSAFHPSGRYFAVGTNSRQLHICRYPEMKTIRSDHLTKNPDIILTRPKQHRGSVYCVGFNPTGELLATGSNDKTIRLMQFNAENCKIGAEFELTFHDGTVRDLIFMEDTSNRTSLLISGGAGNCKINVSDCATGTKLRNFDGHSAPILGLYTWGGCMFVSCSQDKTTRFWDLRCSQAVNTIFPDTKTSNSPVTSVCVDMTGRLLVSGHEDASILLYDIQGSKLLQCYHPHGDQVRTVRFSPGNYYLLSGSYDKKIVITDMRGDLLGNLQYLPVAEHDDKVVQCRWHPHDFTFLSTSADKSTVLWALPSISTIPEENI